MKKIALNITALLFSLILTVACLELAVRAYQILLDRKYGTDNAEAFLHEYDPIRGWRNKPSSSAEFVNREAGIRNMVTINSKGLRDEELAYDKPKGTLRVLLLDASAIAGFEVPQSETIDARLESLLDGKVTSQVINGATRAYGTDQSLLFLMSEGIRYHPDIIIYVVSELDLDDNLVIHKRNRTYGKSYFQLKPDGNLELRGTPVPQEFTPDDRTLMADPLAQRYVDLISGIHPKHEAAAQPENAPKTSLKLVAFRKFLYEHSALYRLIAAQLKNSSLTRHMVQKMGLTRDNDVPKPPDLIDLEWKITSALLKEMKKTSEQANAKFALYEFSNGLSCDPKFDRLEQVSSDLEIPLIKTREKFQKAQLGKERPTFIRDGHWNTRGHRLAAEIIAQFLTEHGWLSTSSEPPQPSS